MTTSSDWPALPPLSEWRETFDTVHLWTQIVGKIRLAQAPFINHWWGTTLYVTARGLTTLAMPCGSRSFQIDFDFIDHTLRIDTSDGLQRRFALAPMSVADFYGILMEALRELNLNVTIWPVPVELEEVIPFEHDAMHASYDAEAVLRLWRALGHVNRVFIDFRARFLGKVSPVHFFWGSFDLAVTRFSGRPAPSHPGGMPNVSDAVMIEAYSHEVSSAGFWPGAGLGEAAFYSYAYPEPDGFRTRVVEPEAAYFHNELREFILPYEAVRANPNPDGVLLTFLQSTYEAAADLALWNRAALERQSSRSN